MPVLNEALQAWATENKINLRDDQQAVANVRRLAHDIVATLSPEQQVQHYLSEQASDREEAARRIRVEASKRRQREAQERLRAEREYQAGQEIRKRFFTAVPYATEADFQKLWPKLWEAHLLDAMNRDRDASMSAQAADPRYSI